MLFDFGFKKAHCKAFKNVESGASARFRNCLFGLAPNVTISNCVEVVMTTKCDQKPIWNKTRYRSIISFKDARLL